MGKLPNFCQLVADLLATRQTILTSQDVANKLATSRCNGIWEVTRHNRHSGLLPAPTCYGLVADWCKVKIHYTSFPVVCTLQVGVGKSPLSLLCRGWHLLSRSVFAVALMDIALDKWSWILRSGRRPSHRRNGGPAAGSPQSHQDVHNYRVDVHRLMVAIPTDSHRSGVRQLQSRDIDSSRR